MTQNDLTKTKYDNVYLYEDKNKKTFYYVNFTLNSKNYQRKNFTKLFGCNTLRQTKDKFEEIKTMIRRGEDPFSKKSIITETVKSVILAQIDDKKPNVKGKDNSEYRGSLRVFYNLYIDDTIGHLLFENIKMHHINKILKNISNLSNGRQKLISVLLYKEFETRFRKRQMEENFLYDVKFGKDEGKTKLDIRLNEDLTSVAKKLYKAIMEQTYKAKIALLLSIMCGRRSGEILTVKNKDVKKDEKGIIFILVNKFHTKTGIDEKYIIPEEVVDLLPSGVFDESTKEELVCQFHKNTIYLNYNKMIEKSDIDIHEEYSLTSHDNRNLFLSLMTQKNYDYNMLDACLSHSNSNRYYEVSYEKRSEIFREYWEILRN